jgi:tRNA(fMet)-specific endonuclease VapC
MLKYMLDNNIAIYIVKNRPEVVRDIFNTRGGQACMSAVSLMELIYGAEKSASPTRNLRVIEGFSARLEVLPYDDNAAIHTGQIRAELARHGKPIGPYDQMIAGHARSQSLILVTNNTKAFKQVPGLRLENWVGKK